VLAYSLRVTPAGHFINWQQDPQSNYLARLAFPERTREFRLEEDLRMKSVTVAVKMRFPLRRYDVRDGLLNETVQHRGNAQGTGLPIWLWNLHTLDRLRLVLARLQLRAYLQPVVSEVLWQFIDCHAVDTRRAFVLAHLLHRTLQVGPIQHLGQQRLGLNRLGLS